MSWKRIRLEAARSREFPEGSHRHGYEIVLPLKPDGMLDQAAMERTPELCSVHRFWEGEGDAIGRVVRQRGTWMIVYDPGGPADEPMHRFAQHRFAEGEYLAIRETGRAEHALRVVSIRAEPGLGDKP